MIKLAMVAESGTDEQLQTLRQIGIDHLVHYEMANAPGKYQDLELAISRAARFGLRVPVVESGPPIDRIVQGTEGWREQTTEWVRLLGVFGTLGVEVVCYNFMPQVLSDAMVVRTSYTARTRGGAITTAYRAADLDPDGLSRGTTPISQEEMRGNLERFLRDVVPAAEAAGVKLAMHPDDPPVTPMCGLERVMSTVESFDWLLSLHSSPVHGITLCAGCFAELGVDVPSLVDRFKDRIHFVHIRNIRGTPRDFTETFPDDGDIDLARLVRSLNRAGFDGYARPDHAPLLATEPRSAPGYGFQGHLFTIGYLRGLLDAC